MMADGFRSIEDKAIFGEVLDLAKKDERAPRSPTGALATAFESLVHQIVYYATGEDKNWEEPNFLLNRAIEFWRSTENRKDGNSIVSLQLEDAEDWRAARLVLQIITDDKPFLVDSVSGALTDASKPVSFFVNAVIDIHRDKDGKRCASGTGTPVRESMIRAEMDPPVNEGEFENLKEEIERVLKDVNIAVEDWEPMRARLSSCIAQLERARPAGVDREDLRESIEFLKWLWDNRFAFLGVRRYRYSDENGENNFVREQSADLGIAKDPEKRILKSTYLDDGTPSPAVLHFMKSGEPVLLAKANTKSTVHRRVHMDYLGVKTYSIDGRVTGEERFIGLFTADAYNRPASDIPLLRAKVQRIAESAGFLPGGHNEKAIVNILETFPRDEMFQGDIDSLREIALGILRLYKRPRPKLFVRRDRFNRFVSVLTFIPRDRFSSQTREQIGAMLAEGFDGWVAAFNPHFGDAALVRVHYIIGLNQNGKEAPDTAELTHQLREITQDWEDGLLEEMRHANGGVAPQGLFSKYEHAFDAGYKELTPPRAALIDISVIEDLGDKTIDLRAYRAENEPDHAIGIKLYCRDEPIQLSQIIPTLENLGLHVIQEQGYRVKVDGRVIWINNFKTEEKNGHRIDIDAVRAHLEDTLLAVIHGATEDDGFNALVLTAGLTWRESAVMRAAARHALQTGFSASQNYIEETLALHADISRALVQVFHTRFNPGGAPNHQAREKEAAKAESAVEDMLQNVESLDQDRIIRRFLNLFRATTRTNFFQTSTDGTPKNHISLKIDTRRIADAPEPKPYRVIFVSGPRVDGVHLRFGPVARGGLRWSDRREDFRTEVLGLVKAQRVKNAVIVPNGSKGGFYPKKLPNDGDRAAIYEEGRAAYSEFIRGLLDVTDNIVAGETQPPPNVISWDEPDPYLVVAADKGTAAFSDTANGISADYGFWLGDAFASGGSVGYDHKVMGITARGAWEAVKRHFREMGKDIQTEPFTVAGVGDMSGDVFGNGMLLSKQIRLIAAFDHRDIFVDPDPDPATSWAERARLFELPRSSWKDYDEKLISKGGGVFSRGAKSIEITAEIAEALDITRGTITPNEFIRAILKSQIELFWLGGIGTYFKDTSEENWRVGDRANDAIRINTSEMRMRVIGEGANLGLTQKARMAYALQGGRLNTDAIDNSAGVDSSDHEVNIKILLGAAIESGDLPEESREDLLKDMTEDVARLVLVHNYEQTRALTQIRATSARDLDAHARLISSLESSGRLDRSLEDLPDEKQIANLKKAKQGLTRPELSVLLAYAKIQLFDEIVDSPTPDDPALEGELFDYFPEQLHQYKDAIKGHRLRREIIATRLANDMINTCGATFAQRAMEATGARMPLSALAYKGACQLLQLNTFIDGVNALDNKISADVQNDLYSLASTLVGETVYQLLRNIEASEIVEAKGVGALLGIFGEPLNELRNDLTEVLSTRALENLAANISKWRDAGVPENLANQAAAMPVLQTAFPIISLARRIGWSPRSTAALFYALGDSFAIDQTREAARALVLDQHYDRMAMRRLTENLVEQQVRLTGNAAAFATNEPKGQPSDWIGDLVGQWREAFDAQVVRVEDYIEGLELPNNLGVGKITLFGDKLAELADRTLPR